MSKIQYFPPMFERLTPRTPWAGGRMTDTDVLTLADAASMATKHAGEPVTIGDFLRAAGRGEITLRAIVRTAAKVQKHDGGIYCNGGQENENRVPAGAIATLPLTACQHLAAAGRASWRTFDGFEIVDGVLLRYTKGELVAGEPDFETVPDDCRVVGYDVHALADEYCAPEDAPQAATPAPVAKETPAERRARWLDMFEAEEKREKRGALQRLANSEGVDRSNMGKDIAKARAERDTQRRAGGWASQLVQDGKRKG